MKVLNYFRVRNKHTGEVREAWCRSRNLFQFCVRRKLPPGVWVCEKSIVWDEKIFNKTF